MSKTDDTLVYFRNYTCNAYYRLTKLHGIFKIECSN